MTDNWKDFKEGIWQTKIDVHNFIQTNYEAYFGDASFLAGPTQRTQQLMKKVQNLFDLVESKGALIKKALGVNDLPINLIGERLDFPWFASDSSPEEIKAYMHFVSALCDKATI